MGEGKDDIRRRHSDDADTELGEDRDAPSTEDACLMGQIMGTGSWLSLLPSYVNRTELGVKEWRDSLFLCYVIKTPNLPDHFDGCGASFEICHTLYCKKGGLITARHN